MLSKNKNMNAIERKVLLTYCGIVTIREQMDGSCSLAISISVIEKKDLVTMRLYSENDFLISLFLSFLQDTLNKMVNTRDKKNHFSKQY